MAVHRLKIEVQPPTLVPMTDKQYQNAVQALTAILLPTVREDLAHNGDNDNEPGRGAR